MFDLHPTPLLPILRELYDLPRDMARFRRYLEILKGGTDDVAVPPLVIANPMAREPVAERVAAWLALDAEALAAEAVAEARRRLNSVPLAGRYRFGVVVADDKGGGWTNRAAAEMGVRFTHANVLKRGWTMTVLWSSDEPTPERLRAEVSRSVYRVAHVLSFGEPSSLDAMMRQEGRASAFAGESPTFDPEDLAYSREVVAPHRGATDPPTQIAGLFGDDAARSLGMTPLGLSNGAGLAVALDDALSAGTDPVAVLVRRTN